MKKIKWDDTCGHTVTGPDGKSYIDFTSGIFATNVGHCNTAVNDAIKAQVERLGHAYDYPTEIRVEYEAELCRCTGFDSVALFSAGTEATEAALRVMLRRGQEIRKNDSIIKIKGGFHGRTAGVQDDGPDIITIDFPDINPWTDRYEWKLPNLEQCSGVILEPYRAADALFYPQTWIDALFGLREKYRFLICFDEIQSGFWRTGRMFGYEHYRVEPDLVCIGKGMANGFPISGLLTKHGLWFDGVPLSSTNGGNPIACAAGLATLGEYDRLRPEYLLFCDYVRELKRCPMVLNINTRGMVAGITLADTETADLVVERCQDLGLLVVHTGGPTIKMGPPLTITGPAIIKGVEILKEVLNARGTISTQGL